MRLFVYGTLQHPDLMAAVAGGVIAPPTPACLSGFQVSRLAGDVVPLIAKADGQMAKGRIFDGLSQEQIARLAHFEGAFGYQRHPMTVGTSDAEVQADVFLPPNTADVGDENWSLEHWAQDHLQPMIYAVEELFAHDPAPDQSELRRMWPVIEKRAWARHRAILAKAAPAQLRYDAKAGDAAILDHGPVRGEFFRIQAMDVEHRQFDGGRSDILRREVFLGVDAVLVLPYDPASGHILLVEQARMGPLRRGDANPWTLEPIAGMTDARETPDDAARREAEEEAGIVVDRLDHMFSIYPSPGSSTDFFVCYCTPCTLPDRDAYLGGLDEEAEDLRIHQLPLTDALAMIDTGEINAGPLVAMLLWLDRNKDRYRATS